MYFEECYCKASWYANTLLDLSFRWVDISEGTVSHVAAKYVKGKK